MRVPGIALVFAAMLAARALAQPYSGITPLPRTTDPAVLHAQANEREIAERIRIGVSAIDAGAWRRAADEFTRVLALRPREPQASTASYDLGISLANAGDLDPAVRAFDDAIRRDPGFLAARANLVTALLMRGDLAAARTAADAFVAAAPESARALYARGIVALKAGDAPAALLDFQKLLANDPKYAVAHYDLALAEQRLGKYAEAERELRAAIALSPQYTRASVALGSILLRQGKRDEARAVFDGAARDTEDAVLRNLAVSLRDAIRH